MREDPISKSQLGPGLGRPDVILQESTVLEA